MSAVWQQVVIIQYVCSTSKFKANQMLPDVGMVKYVSKYVPWSWRMLASWVVDCHSIPLLVPVPFLPLVFSMQLLDQGIIRTSLLVLAENIFTSLYMQYDREVHSRYMRLRRYTYRGVKRQLRLYIHRSCGPTYSTTYNILYGECATDEPFAWKRCLKLRHSSQ